MQNLLTETSMLRYILANIPTNPNSLLDHTSSEGFNDKRLKTLIYLIMIRPNITFSVRVVNQFMESSKQINWDAIYPILI